MTLGVSFKVDDVYVNEKQCFRLTFGFKLFELFSKLPVQPMSMVTKENMKD